MAFARAGWNPIGGMSKRGSAPQMWSYTTTDSLATMNTSAYTNCFFSRCIIQRFWSGRCE